MDILPERLMKLRMKMKKKPTPLDRMMKGEMTEEDMDKYIVHHKEDKRKKQMGMK